MLTELEGLTDLDRASIMGFLRAVKSYVPSEACLVFSHQTVEPPTATLNLDDVSTILEHPPVLRTEVCKVPLIENLSPCRLLTDDALDTSLR
jgi:hypothetical protein